MYSYISAFGKPEIVKGKFSIIDFFDILFTIFFTVDIGLRFLITYHDKYNKKITTVKEIAYNYMKYELVYDFLTTVPLMRIIQPEIIWEDPLNIDKTHVLKDMEFRLIYLVKILRMKKAYYLLDTSKFKSILFNFYERQRLDSIAIMKDEKVNEDDLLCIDYTQINRQLEIIFMFRSFKLVILLFISSYIVGIGWFIMCNFNKVNGEANHLRNLKYSLDSSEE